MQRLIDTDKAFKKLNERIQQHDQMAYESGLDKVLEDNQIPGWWWGSIIEESSVSSMELTNGDVIKAMFPSVVIRVVIESQIGISFFDSQNEINWIPIDWWNAPYKVAKYEQATEKEMEKEPHYFNEQKYRKGPYSQIRRFHSVCKNRRII